MKRPASLADSPPPSGTPGPSSSAAAAAPKAKKPRQSRAKGAKAAAKVVKAGSPPASGAESPFPAASSPPAAAADSPFGGGGSRERSASVAAGEGGKGKERAVEGVEGTVQGGLGGQGEPQEDEEAEDEAFAFDDDEFGSNQREAAKQKEDLRVLLEHFDEQQMDRYEAYRRSGLAKGSVRKLVNQVLGQSVSPSILTVVRGFAKVFVGEIVEKARSIADHPGALTPQDLREAYRLYLEEHDTAGAGAPTRKKMFVR
ncbi:hypothetical protein JCM8547_002434 [Rhodosporidiobolus lusitaniae]